MPSVFEKLNLKDQNAILVLNAPQSFEPELTALRGVTVLRGAAAKQVSFALAFAITQKELDAASKALVKKASGDAVLWIAHPKGMSKKYKCEFNRDSGWTVLGQAGYEPVRMVAIDEDWSALRFRRVEFIKAMTRRVSSAMTKEGKAKTKQKSETK